MPEENFDVVVVGAGAAGLSALAELRRVGLRVLCVEARDRIGGRILTVHDNDSPVPIELGPEFIHGRPPEIWEIVRTARLAVYDCDENAVQIRNGEPQERGDAWEQIGKVSAKMEEVERRGEDPTFLEFISNSSFPPEVRENATNFVEGFNAAHKEIVGVASLAQDHRASQAIDGDKNFRILNGYESLPHALAQADCVRLQHVVERVDWSKHAVTLRMQHTLVNESREVQARHVVLTLPLGVLQARAVEFDPEPGKVLRAADALRFGHVMRVVLRFRHAWWEYTKHLADTGFWLSQEEYFPTWWTTLPVRAPLLVGWSAGPHADRLVGKSHKDLVQCALRDLGRIAKADEKMLGEQLLAAYFHNWSSDPFARGAYSYVPAGALLERRALAEPVEDTLFFAGEATETEGHSATVHGAIASGRRAARQIISSRAELD